MREPFEPTPENPLIVSASEFNQFRRCRLQWNWDKRVGLKSRKVGAPRVNGILVHEAKEVFMDLPRKKRTPEMMAKVALQAIKKVKEVPVESKDRLLALAMLDGYTRWVTGKHDKSDRAIGKKIVYPEWNFILPLVKDRSILIRGFIDEMFVPTIYKRVLAFDETKTKTQFDFNVMDLDSQMTTYLWALWKAVTEFPEVLPRPLRAMRFEKFIAWRTVLRRQMPGPRVKAPLFARESIERGEDELRMWEVDARRIARDMLDAAIYPTPTKSCEWDCDFFQLCQIRSDKEDLKHIIDTEFDIS